VRFIGIATPGTTSDVIGRTVGESLARQIGQSVVVENRAGANGGIAVNALATSPADGYTFVVTDGTIVTINPQLYLKLPYDPKEVLPIATLARAPMFLAVHPKVPSNTMKEFIDYVKARPGQLNYGSSGVGSIHHLAMEGLKASLQLNITHVPYKGTGESVPALLGGHVETLFAAYPSISGAAQNKSIKVLATSGSQRWPQAPEVPVVADYIPGFDFAPLVGIFARVGTPQAIVSKVAGEAIAVTKEAEVLRALNVVGAEPVSGGPDVHQRAMKDEYDRVAKAIAAAGLKPE
jgi:tripartite-type tricarboxylate transporter receptor subunit TctC